MILAARVDSFKSYLDNPALVLKVALTCPACQTRSLSRHGAVLRWVYFIDVRRQITIFRLRCRPCRITATLLPDFLVPYTRYAAEVLEAATSSYFAGPGSLREVALAVSGVVVPPELAPSGRSDAIDFLKPKPGFQRVHTWTARIGERAAADVAEAAAWLTHRVPTSTIVDHLTTPLPPRATGVPPRANCVPPRSDLDGARRLVRVFTDVPELNADRTGWLAAWLRTMAVIALAPSGGGLHDHFRSHAVRDGPTSSRPGTVGAPKEVRPCHPNHTTRRWPWHVLPASPAWSAAP